MDKNELNLPAREEPGAAELVKAEAPKPKGLMRSAVDALTGKDLPRLVDSFTAEMVVVTEGLYADQESLRSSLKTQGEEQDKLSARLRDMEKQLKELSGKVDSLSARAQKLDKGEKGLYRILRQSTWLAAILAGAWVITTLVNALIK